MRTSGERGSILPGLVWIAAVGCVGCKPDVAIQPEADLPARELTIEGVPDDLASVTLVYRPAEKEWAGLYLEEQVERDEAGSFVAFVPVHPAGVAEGGTLNLEIQGIEQPPLQLRVQPAPPAPGTSREYAAGAARVSRSLITSWGAPVDEVLLLLEEDPEALPIQLLLPALVAYLIDGLQPEASFLELLDEAGRLDADPLDVDGADRLLAVMDLPSAMESAEAAAAEMAKTPITEVLVDAANQGAPPISALPRRRPAQAEVDALSPPEVLGGAMPWGPLATTAASLSVTQGIEQLLSARHVAGPSAQESTAEGSGQADTQASSSWTNLFAPGADALLEELEEQADAMATAAFNPVYSQVKITTVGELDSYMQRRSMLKRELLGPAGKDARATSVKYLGMVPALAIIGFLNYMLDLSLQTNLNLLPSRLDDLEVWAERKEFLEDQAGSRKWEAWVVAHSDSMSLDPSDVIKALQQILSLAKWLQSMRPSPSLKEQMWAEKQKLGEAWSEKLHWEVEAAHLRSRQAQFRPPPVGSQLDAYGWQTFGKKLEGIVKKWMTGKFLKALEEGPLKVKYGPYRWGPIPMGTDLGFVKARTDGSCVKIVSEARQPYKAAEAGDCLLVIETNEKRFGGASSSGSQALKVKTIVVDVQPGGRKVTPGSQLVFEATVWNAKNKTVEWEATGGEGAKYGDNSRWRWKAPSKLEKGKCRELFTVFAESMTEAGPREGREPPRVGQASVWVEEPANLQIVPHDVRLKPDEEVTFEVVRDDLEVEWKVARNGGKIVRSSSQSMRYRAPKKEGGPYTVTARVKGQKGDCAEAQANVLVREVDQMCSVQASWQGGGIGGTVNWDPDVHSASVGFNLGAQSFVVEVGGRFQLGAMFERPIEPQSPGTYTGRATGFSVFVDSHSFPLLPGNFSTALSLVPVQLNISRWNVDEIEGSVSAGPFFSQAGGPEAPKEWRSFDKVWVHKNISVSTSATFSASGDISPPFDPGSAWCNSPSLPGARQ